MDTLSVYLSDIARYPLLTKEQEILLARQIQEWKNTENPTPRQERMGKRAHDKLVKCNLRLVVSVAKRYHKRTKRCHFLDIIQEGNLGLAHGVTKFDPERGYALSTYVYWWIRQSITRYLSTQDRIIRVPGNTIEVLSKIQQYMQNFMTSHGRTPTVTECAEFIGVPTKRMEEYLALAPDCVSLDAQLRKADVESALLDVIADDSLEDPLDLLNLQLGYDHIGDLLAQLDPTDRMIVERSFCFNGAEPTTLQKLGSELGISRERVRQRLNKSLARLRVAYNKGGYREGRS